MSIENILEKEPEMYIIGVCGPSCGGKTTTCENIIKKIKGISEKIQIIVIKQDDFYYGGDSSTNYDVPDAIDWSALVESLSELKKGNKVELPIYDFSNHSRKKNTLVVQAEHKCIILVEGILIFTNKKVLDLLDLKVFITADPELRYERRIKRDVEERGRSRDEVKKRYFEHVKPSNSIYVEPTQIYADAILLNNKDNNFIGLLVLLNHIKVTIHEIYKII